MQVSERQGKAKTSPRNQPEVDEGVSGTFQAVPARVIDPNDNKNYCPQHPRKHPTPKKQPREQSCSKNDVGSSMRPQSAEKTHVLQKQAISEKQENSKRRQIQSKIEQKSTLIESNAIHQNEEEEIKRAQDQKEKEDEEFQRRQKVEQKRNMEHQRLQAIEKQRKMEIQRLQEEQQNQRIIQMEDLNTVVQNEKGNADHMETLQHDVMHENKTEHRIESMNSKYCESVEEHRVEKVMKTQTTSATSAAIHSSTQSIESKVERTELEFAKSDSKPSREHRGLVESVMKPNDRVHDVNKCTRDTLRDDLVPKVQPVQDTQPKSRHNHQKVGPVNDNQKPRMNAINATEIDAWRKDKQQQLKEWEMKKRLKEKEKSKESDIERKQQEAKKLLQEEIRSKGALRKPRSVNVNSRNEEEASSPRSQQRPTHLKDNDTSKKKEIIEARPYDGEALEASSIIEKKERTNEEMQDDFVIVSDVNEFAKAEEIAFAETHDVKAEVPAQGDNRIYRKEKDEAVSIVNREKEHPSALQTSIKGEDITESQDEESEEDTATYKRKGPINSKNDSGWFKVTKPSLYDKANDPNQLVKAAKNLRRSITPKLGAAASITSRGSPVESIESRRSATPRVMRTNKFAPFETEVKEKNFSVSGIWNNVHIGLVKDRMRKWKTMDDGVAPSPSRPFDKQEKVLKKAKRRSRVIDPNEWVLAEVEIKKNSEEKEKEQGSKNESLHKSISMGDLAKADTIDLEEENNKPVMSKAVAAWEQRPDGRKSADIFVSEHKKKNLASSQNETVREESYEQMFEDEIENIVPESSCDETTTQTESDKIEVFASKDKTVGIEKRKEMNKQSAEELEKDQTKVKSNKNEGETKTKQAAQELKESKSTKKKRAAKEFEADKLQANDKHREDERDKAEPVDGTNRSQEDLSVESSDFIQKYKVDKEEVKRATTTKIEATSSIAGGAPKIPWRSSSKQVVKEKLAAQRSSPSLSLVNVMISTAEPKTGTDFTPEKASREPEELPPVPPLPEIIMEKKAQTKSVALGDNISTTEVAAGKDESTEMMEEDKTSHKSNKQKVQGNWMATKGEMDRKLREQEEQEKRFKARLKVEQRYRETRADTSDDTSSASLYYQSSLPTPYNPNPPPIPPPPELGPSAPAQQKEKRDQLGQMEAAQDEAETKDPKQTEQRKPWDDEEKERMEAKRLCVQQLHQIKNESKPQKKVNLSNGTETTTIQELELIRAQELKELQRLREMERRKQAIEEEIAKEKQHLMDLQLLELDSMEKTKANTKPKAATQYEAMVAKKAKSSPLPPPTPSPRTHFLRPTMQPQNVVVKNSTMVCNVAKMTEEEARKRMQQELKTLHELKILEEQKRMEIEDLKRQSEEELSLSQSSKHMKTEFQAASIEREPSLEDTIKDLETTTNQLKEFAERHCSDKDALENMSETNSTSICSLQENRKATTEYAESQENTAATADEIKDAAGAVREVAHALLKALTPTPEQSDDQYPVPEGIVKNVKSALQKLEEIPPSPNFQTRVGKTDNSHISNTGNSSVCGRKSVEIEEELKEMQHTGKVKNTASLFKSSSASDNRTPGRKTFPSESSKPSRRIGSLFKVEHKKWNQPVHPANSQNVQHKVIARIIFCCRKNTNFKSILKYMYSIFNVTEKYFTPIFLK